VGGALSSANFQESTIGPRKGIWKEGRLHSRRWVDSIRHSMHDTFKVPCVLIGLACQTKTRTRRTSTFSSKITSAESKRSRTSTKTWQVCSVPSKQEAPPREWTSHGCVFVTVRGKRIGGFSRPDWSRLAACDTHTPAFFRTERTSELLTARPVRNTAYSKSRGRCL